jgi:hypothetical protein
MAIHTGVTCPHCSTGKVETIRKVWFLYGFLIFARYGSKTLIGCETCVKNAVWKNFAVCLLGGWWCFPWGLATPVVLAQNLSAALTAPSPDKERADLEGIFASAGIPLTEVQGPEDRFRRPSATKSA